MEIKEILAKLDDFNNGFMEFKSTIEKRIDEIEAKLNRPRAEQLTQEQKENLSKKAYLNYLRIGVKEMLKPEEQKALVEDTATAGVLVPEEYYSEILTSLKHKSIVRKFAKAITIKGNKLNVRSMTDVTMGWGKLETGQQTLSDNTPSFSKSAIEVKDLVGLIKIGRDLLQDSDVALEQFILSTFGNRAGYYEDKAFFLGDGNLQPLGVLNDTNIIPVISGSAGTIVSDDILEMYFALKEEYRANAIWVMNSAVEKALRKLKDNNGNYMLQRDLSSPTGRTLLGRPIFNFDDLEGNIATGNDVILFGDFTNGFLILDKVNGMSTQRLVEKYAEQGQVGVLLYHRVGGGVITPEAFAKLTIQ